MISKAASKFIKSLQIKKYRKQEQCFVVEGLKSVQELLASDFEIVNVVGTASYLETLPSGLSGKAIEATEKDLQAMGEFQSNDSCLAIARMKPNLPVTLAEHEFALVLDDIRDPGNMGTMIRTADWYGISKIVVSNESVDVYSHKVITSTMGSFTRVHVFYTDLPEYLATVSKPVYGAFLDGKDIHTMTFTGGGYIVIGNESNGISRSVEQQVTQRITIPRYGRAESLNAAIATAVICDNIRR